MCARWVRKSALGQPQCFIKWSQEPSRCLLRSVCLVWLDKYFVEERIHHRGRGSPPDPWILISGHRTWVSPLFSNSWFCTFCAIVSCITVETFTSLCLISSTGISNSVVSPQGTILFVFESSAICFSSRLLLGDSRDHKKTKDKNLVRGSSDVLCLWSWPQPPHRAL